MRARELQTIDAHQAARRSRDAQVDAPLACTRQICRGSRFLLDTRRDAVARQARQILECQLQNAVALRECWCRGRRTHTGS